MKLLLCNIVVFFCFQFFISASAPEHWASNPEEAAIIIMTTPKSGSHLVEKLINLMRFEKKEFFSSRFWICHFDFTPNGIDIQEYIKRKDKKFVITVRDPINSVGSLLSHLELHPKDFGKNTEQVSFFSQTYPFKLSISERLFYLLSEANQHITKDYWDCYHYSIKFSEKENCHVVKFENLIPPSKGGNIITQINEISNLAKFLDLGFSHEQMYSILKKLNNQDLVIRETNYEKGNHDRYESEISDDYKTLIREKTANYCFKFGYNNHY